jgi:hypothetical protein
LVATRVLPFLVVSGNPSPYVDALTDIEQVPFSAIKSVNPAVAWQLID